MFPDGLLWDWESNDWNNWNFGTLGTDVSLIRLERSEAVERLERLERDSFLVSEAIERLGTQRNLQVQCRT
jgi:hypothetical protein